MKEHVVLTMCFKIDNGYYMEKSSIKRNKISIRKMKTKRKNIRAVKKGIIVKENKKTF